MQFKSKNGPMELSMSNMSYAMETLFYRVGAQVRQIYNYTPSNQLGHVFNNLLGAKISKDMYIPALMVWLCLESDEMFIPVTFDGKTFALGPNSVADLRVGLNTLFMTGANSDIFTLYKGLEYGQISHYRDMSDEHKINAIVRRIGVMKFPELSWKQHIPLLNDLFNMEVFASLDKEVNAIYNYLKENAK